MVWSWLILFRDWTSSEQTFISAISVLALFPNLCNVWYFRYHPDKTANDPIAADMFKEVTFSYNILSDPEKRRQYDTAGFEVRFVCIAVLLIYSDL